MRPHRHAHAEQRRDDVAADQRAVPLVVGMRDQGDAGRDQLGPRRLDLDCLKSGRPVEREPHPVVRARHFPIFELRLGHRRAEVHVPQRGRLDLVRQPPPQQPQERYLRDALGPRADRGVGHRPVDRQPEVAPERFERLLVGGREPGAQLDEVRPRDRTRRLRRRLRRLEPRIVGQRRIAPDAVVVLHAALGRQAVVVPSHRIEDVAAAHALEARDYIGVGIREDVPDVQRPADGRGRRVDREHLGARAAALEPIGRAFLPAGPPLGFESLERRLRGQAQARRNPGASTSSGATTAETSADLI